MGLGGYLTWTATAREIRKKYGNHIKLLPVEQHGNFLKYVKSEVFENNEDFCNNLNLEKENFLLPLILNNPNANYCKKDTPEKAYHRYDKHIIEQQCELYGIENPELKCKLNVSGNDMFIVREFIKNKIKTEKFITIEPNSKINYTKNRVYPFEKWQLIVDKLSKKIPVVQVGVKNSKLLNNVIDATGIFSFKRTAKLISWSKLFLSTEGGLTHANSCFEEGKSLVVITGYQSEKMIAYPQNINVNISSHGPCGMKIQCPECKKDAENHNWKEIVDKVEKELCI
jgi:ADP-heptose:LPS heptosyltransferase